MCKRLPLFSRFCSGLIAGGSLVPVTGVHRSGGSSFRRVGVSLFNPLPAVHDTGIIQTTKF